MCSVTTSSQLALPSSSKSSLMSSSSSSMQGQKKRTFGTTNQPDVAYRYSGTPALRGGGVRWSSGALTSMSLHCARFLSFNGDARGSRGWWRPAWWNVFLCVEFTLLTGLAWLHWCCCSATVVGCCHGWLSWDVGLMEDAGDSGASYGKGLFPVCSFAMLQWKSMYGSMCVCAKC